MHDDARERVNQEPVALDPPTGFVDRDIAQQLAIDCHQDAQSILLMLRGEIDLASSGQLQHTLADAVSKASRIVIDLAGVDFIDSTGVATLIRAQRYADTSGHSLELRRIPRQARQLFELAGVAGVIVTD